MRSLCSLTRNIVVQTKSSPRLTLRTFTATTPHHKYQIPKQKKDNRMSTTTTLKGQPLDRQVLDSMLRRRMFYTPSFEIYNGVAGLVRIIGLSYCIPQFARLFEFLALAYPRTTSYALNSPIYSEILPCWVLLTSFVV